MITAAVIGAGAWGTSIANLLGVKGHRVRIWAREPQVVETINTTAENSLFFPGFPLSPNVSATTQLAEALGGADLVVNVVPTQFIRSTWKDLEKGSLPRGAIYVNASKGIEQGSLSLISRIFEEIFPHVFHEKLVTLSGPSFAEEVALGHPTSVTAASHDSDLALTVAEWFHLPYFRVYTSDDPVGVQLGGALKNVMAIAAGAVDGLGLGLNTRAALITRGLSEIARLGLALGARQETFIGLSGMGDLILTCTGSLSRNRTVGFKLGSGVPIDQILRGSNTVAEGVATAKSAMMLARKHEVDMPITRAVYGGIYEGKSASEALTSILARDLKHDGI
ncbi:NAD(P)-dependent glycerol-3-phosphate dehydrogenase [Myxococcota bacterium]|nr:NAD(P)-dependent glycerol-3-phosphate dehydrogenase [Myxococcota bacterium]MBU1535972.1 NAD(P)-dependent glycerol-3-phosphate dehydrogenase [Myxococcota bacterium]